MDKNDLKAGDKLREISTGEIWEVSEFCGVSPSVWLTKGNDADMVSFGELDLYEKVLIFKEDELEECESDDSKPICYNHIKVTQLIETIKQYAQINEVDINNFTILKTSYNPDDGSMLFEIKLN